MSLYEDERFNYVRFSCILENVHAMLTSLFRQCYSKKFNGKEWSENCGTLFHDQDKFSGRYREDQKKCITSVQVKDWDISLLCDILLNSSYFFLVDPSLQLEVQCEFKGCKTKDCKNNQHGSNTLKFKSREDSAKLSGLTALLRVGSKRPQRITFRHALDMGIVVKEKLHPNEYTIYPCSKKWVAVDQLRDIRNDYAHMNIYKISEQDLMDKARKVKEAYEAIDKETSEIDAIMSECVLDHKKWQTEWEKCTENVRQLKAKFEAVETGVYYIKFDDIKQGLISEIKEDTGRQLISMKEGLISEIKEDTGRQLTSMKEGLISELKSIVANQEHIHDSKTQKKVTSSQFKEGLPLAASTASTSSSNTSISSMDADHPMSNVSHPTPSFSSSYTSIPISPHGHCPSLYESDHMSRDVGKVLRPLAPSAPPPKQELFVRIDQPLQQPNSQMNICPPQGRTTFWIAGNEPPNLSQQIPLPTSQALPPYTFQAPPPISQAPSPTTQKLLLGSKGLELLRKHSLSERDLIIKCGDDLFHELSNKAVHTPHTLAIRLGLGRVDIEQIERDYKSDYKRQITQIFWKWRERNGKDATFLLLIDAFIEEENIEAAEIVLDFFKNHCQTPFTKCFSWSNGQSESRQKSGVASDSYRRHSLQEVQKRPQRYSSRMETHGKPYRTTFENKRGQLQLNNDFSQSFDFFFDEIVAVLSGDKKLFRNVVEAISTSHFLTHPIEKEKALRNPLLVIGCKTLITDVWTFINRARNPERALQRLLLILQKFDQLKHIANYIEAKALETRKCTLLGMAHVTEKKEVQDQTLFVVHDTTEVTDTSIAAAESHTVVQRYAEKLKNFYLTKLPADPKWSPAKDRNFLEFIDLVVVSLQSRSKDEVSPMLLANLFNVSCGSSLLIEGVPGIGKSTLAYEMCKRWANSNALQKYSLVLLLRLRDDDVQRYWSPDKLEELIGRYLKLQSWKPQVIQEIIDNDGKGLLVILEGFDELPENKQLELDVLESMMCNLSEATIIITTRTSTAHDLAERFRFKKHIEIRGFNECSQNRYIKAFFKNDTVKQESFKKYMNQYPIISGCLHIPLNLAILLEIFVKHAPSELPQTMTELYQLLIKMLIYRELHSRAPPGTQISIPSLRELPDATTQKAFRNICLLAYESIFTRNKQQLVFYDSEKYETLGLMQREPKVLLSEGGDTYAYSFLHLTIQEFLAAYHIYCLTPRDIHRHLNNSYFQHNFKMSVTMRFLAGLTEFQGRNITIPNNISSLNIFHQLMETKKDDLISQIFNEHQKFKVARIPTVITEQDFYVLGKCIALSSCNWRFGFTLRALTDKHMNMFVSGFNSVSGTALSSKKCPRLEHIGLSLNPLGSEGVICMLSLPPFILNTISEFNLRATTLNKECLKHCIAMLRYFSNLKIMLFHDNSFKEGEQQPLIDVLCTLKNLKKVSFSNLDPAECDSVLMGSQSIREVELYELSPSSIEAVFTTLSQCRTLECIEIYQSQITKEIAEKALTQSHPFPFQSLKLINCAIDSDTAGVIVDAVTCSPTLQTLDLSDNIIDDIGGCYIAGRIGLITAKSLPLSEIFLHHNSFSEATIYCLIDQLAWCPLDVFIYLSLQWEVVIHKHVDQCPFQKGALKHFKFERPNTHTST